MIAGRVIAFVLVMAGVLGLADAADHPWLLVDTAARAVVVMQDGHAIARYEDIAVGRGGVTDLHLVGDQRTPRGEYRIIRINNNSRYDRFFEFDYPTVPHAREALSRQLIDRATYRRIIDDHQRYGTAPQDTPLGGELGIHGLGHADLAIHESFNWTTGCIALTNGQVDALAHWVQIGTRVVVK